MMNKLKPKIAISTAILGLFLIPMKWRNKIE